jgi:rhodanese-related sulfurtransferase
MCATRVNAETLKAFEPLGSLSEARLNELAAHCQLEAIGRNSDPFLVRSIAGQAVYLLRGELALTYPDGTSRILMAGSERSRYPVAQRGEVFTSAKTVTDVELVRIDDDLLDVTTTWDQVASVEGSPAGPAKGVSALANWSMMSGMFSVASLKYGAFSQLPPAHIEELLSRFQRTEVRKNEVVISEGAEGDFYFVIENGRCRVERMVGGEEALVSDVKRNATVTMKTDGTLLRLSKKDFVELLREPLLRRVAAEEARAKVANGAQWIDVRYPSEYQYDRLPGAINIPLSDIRNAFGALDKSKEYVLYCQSERRSAAAAFLLAQRGFKTFVLAGGLWGEARRK